MNQFILAYWKGCVSLFVLALIFISVQVNGAAEAHTPVIHVESLRQRLLFRPWPQRVKILSIYYLSRALYHSHTWVVLKTFCLQ